MDALDEIFWGILGASLGFATLLLILEPMYRRYRQLYEVYLEWKRRPR